MKSFQMHEQTFDCAEKHNCCSSEGDCIHRDTLCGELPCAICRELTEAVIDYQGEPKKLCFYDSGKDRVNEDKMR